MYFITISYCNKIHVLKSEHVLKTKGFMRVINSVTMKYMRKYNIET